jgi:hypothetical protein
MTRRRWFCFGLAVLNAANFALSAHFARFNLPALLSCFLFAAVGLYTK